MAGRRYHEDYPLNFKLIEYHFTYRQLVVLLLITASVFIFILSVTIEFGNNASAIGILISFVLFYLGIYLINPELRIEEVGEAILYSDLIVIEDSNGSYAHELGELSKVHFHFEEGVVKLQEGKLHWLVGMLEAFGATEKAKSSIKIDIKGEAPQKHYIFFEYTSKEGLVERRLNEWKRKGYGVTISGKKLPA